MWPTLAGSAPLPGPVATRPRTDPRDAQVLSRYGQVFVDSESPVVQLEPEREELRELLRRRRQLVEQRVQEMSRLDKAVLSI